MDRRLENNSFESVQPCRPQAGDRWGCSGMGVCSNESRSQSHHLPVPLLPPSSDNCNAHSNSIRQACHFKQQGLFIQDNRLPVKL